MKISRKHTLILLIAAIVGALFVLKNNPGLFVPKNFLVNSYYYHQIAPADSLRIKIYSPKNELKSLHPTVVMFHGGGWKDGGIGQFYRHAEFFAERGINAILVEYRTQRSHGTLPFEALKDARSAMRFIKEKSVQLKVDTTKLVAMGSSSGGHLALGTTILDSYNHGQDNLKINPSPKALVLLSGIIDTGPSGYGSKEVKKAYKEFSPMRNIRPGVPPLLMLFGQEDIHTSVSQATTFCTSWRQNNNHCSLEITPGQGHGFTNPTKSQEHYKAMLERVLKFFRSNGILPPEGAN